VANYRCPAQLANLGFEPMKCFLVESWAFLAIAATAFAAQLFASIGCGGCHTLSAAGWTGETGPNRDEALAPDDDTAGIEEMSSTRTSRSSKAIHRTRCRQTYGHSLSKPEVQQLAEYLVATIPTKP
jgi:cytochrome c553